MTNENVLRSFRSYVIPPNSCLASLKEWYCTRFITFLNIIHVSVLQLIKDKSLLEQMYSVLSHWIHLSVKADLFSVSQVKRVCISAVCFQISSCESGHEVTVVNWLCSFPATMHFSAPRLLRYPSVVANSHRPFLSSISTQLTRFCSVLRANIIT